MEIEYVLCNTNGSTVSIYLPVILPVGTEFKIPSVKEKYEFPRYRVTGHRVGKLEDYKIECKRVEKHYLPK